LIDPTLEPTRLERELDNLVEDVGNNLLRGLIDSLFGRRN